jgi:hypothetical protein
MLNLRWKKHTLLLIKAHTHNKPKPTTYNPKIIEKQAKNTHPQASCLGTKLDVFGSKVEMISIGVNGCNWATY